MNPKQVYDGEDFDSTYYTFLAKGCDTDNRMPNHHCDRCYTLWTPPKHFPGDPIDYSEFENWIRSPFGKKKMREQGFHVETHHRINGKLHHKEWCNCVLGKDHNWDSHIIGGKWVQNMGMASSTEGY